jgi:hypothetical protein
MIRMARLIDMPSFNGVELGKVMADARLRAFKSPVTENSGEEGQEPPSYMNVSNLQAMKANIEYLLSHVTEETEIGNWAEDHIAVAAHELSQVADYFRSKEQEIDRGSNPTQ